MKERINYSYLKRSLGDELARKLCTEFGGALISMRRDFTKSFWFVEIKNRLGLVAAERVASAICGLGAFYIPLSTDALYSDILCELDRLVIEEKHSEGRACSIVAIKYKVSFLRVRSIARAARETKRKSKARQDDEQMSLF